MSVRFLIRFNLQDHSTAEERQAYLNEFEAIQGERVNGLKKTCREQIRILEGKRVLFLGDSITSDNLGYRLSVSRAANLLATDGSVSGATTATLLPLAKAKMEESPYDLISVMLGANDSVTLEEEGRQQVSLEEYSANMNHILGLAKNSGASVLLLGITPVQEERFAQSFAGEKKRKTNQTVSAYNHRLAELAKQYEIPMVSHSWLTDDRFLEKDGIHLTPLGQEKLSETWLHAASKIMKERKT